MPNIDLEYGPYSNSPIPVGAGLSPELFGYGHSWRHSAASQALSTGRALMGVNATAMGALDILRSGGHPGYVVFDLTARLR